MKWKTLLITLGAMVAIATPLLAQQRGGATDAMEAARERNRQQRPPTRAEVEAALRAHQPGSLSSGVEPGHMVWFIANSQGAILASGIVEARSLAEALPAIRKAHPSGVIRREHSAQVQGSNGWVPVAWLTVD